jgi:hypothetical protein
MADFNGSQDRCAGVTCSPIRPGSIRVPIIICCKIKQFNPIGVMDGLLERIEKAPPIERIGDVSASDGTPGTTIGGFDSSRPD